MSVARKAARITGAVFGSRVLGLVRETILASLFGASFASDAYRVAFKIPNLLRDLFAEGALSTAFVTTFSKTLEKQGDEAGWRLANRVFTAQLLVLGLLTVLGVTFAPAIVEVMGAGLEPRTRELCIELTRIMFPFIMLVSTAAVVMGLLNAKGRFGLPASASMFFNLGSICSGLFFGWLFDPELGPRAIYGVAWGVLVGGAAQLLIQVPAVLKLGYRYKPDWNWRDPDFKEVLRLLAPAVMGGAAVQVNVAINTVFASMQGPGSISWLELAFRLMQFPIGLLGVAIATVTLPQVSRDAAREDTGAFRKNLAQSVRLSFFLTVPAAVGLAVVAELLVAVIFERGRFYEADTVATAQALQAYAVGLAGYAGIKVIAPAFAALGKPHIPLRVSLFGIALNIALNLFFWKVCGFGHWGLALSTSCVALLNFFQLAMAMRGQLGGFEGRELLLCLVRTLLASAAMAAAVYAVQALLGPLWQGGLFGSGKAAVFVADTVLLTLSIGAGGLVFMLAAWLFKCTEAREFVQAVQQAVQKRLG